MKNSVAFFIFAFLLIFPDVGYSQNPKYENSILTIPAVDTADSTGALQDVVIELKENGDLALLDFKESIKIPSGVINAVELIQTDSFPVQVLLKVDGILVSGCADVGKSLTRMVEKTIEVSLYFKNNDALFNPGDYACPAWIRYFTEYIPLPVFNLAEGDYKYDLNGEFDGEFNLSNFNGF